MALVSGGSVHGWGRGWVGGCRMGGPVTHFGDGGSRGKVDGGAGGDSCGGIGGGDGGAVS